MVVGSPLGASHRGRHIAVGYQSGTFFGPLVSRLDWQVGDVLDRGLWQRLSRRTDISYLVHGAAATSMLRHVHAEGPGQPGLSGVRHSIVVNIDGALNLLEFAASITNLKRMVHVSSGSVYGEDGPSDRPLREDEYVVPQGLYGVSKFAGEAFCRFCADELDLPACVVRLSGVYGPMDRVTPSRDVQCVPNVIAHKGRSLSTTLRHSPLQFTVQDLLSLDWVG